MGPLNSLWNFHFEIGLIGNSAHYVIHDEQLGSFTFRVSNSTHEVAKICNLAHAISLRVADSKSFENMQLNPRVSNFRKTMNHVAYF